jgi:hypothetical protein
MSEPQHAVPHVDSTAHDINTLNATYRSDSRTDRSETRDSFFSSEGFRKLSVLFAAPFILSLCL